LSAGGGPEPAFRAFDRRSAPENPGRSADARLVLLPVRCSPSSEAVEVVTVRDPRETPVRKVEAMIKPFTLDTVTARSAMPVSSI
jgi:hypothetical protein